MLGITAAAALGIREIAAKLASVSLAYDTKECWNGGSNNLDEDETSSCNNNSSVAKY